MISTSVCTLYKVMAASTHSGSCHTTIPLELSGEDSQGHVWIATVQVYICMYRDATCIAPGPGAHTSHACHTLRTIEAAQYTNM